MSTTPPEIAKRWDTLRERRVRVFEKEDDYRTDCIEDRESMLRGWTKYICEIGRINGI